ncbi:hypothetical protein TRAPUB_6263 [Trametes pubescens]|uniref:Uncharacterized protein n=1 Tax=Trametes pubescens TaxID=154538 RepID=A0A1M2V6N7_TRAPU|nr:hypothetical protein TRAPUB_6263 [Trametes pubescens]
MSFGDTDVIGGRKVGLTLNDPPTRSESSDDDAPEAFSFGTSKKAAKGEEEAVRQFQAAEKLKRKEKNRTIDRKLKARAAETKSTGKSKAATSHWEKATKGKGAEFAADFSEEEDASEAEEGPSGRTALEDRMARAMKDAEEEDSDLDDLDEEEGSTFEGFAGEDVGMDAGIAEDDGDEEMSEEDEDGDELEDEDSDEEADEDEEMASGSEKDVEEEEEEDTYTKPSAQKHNYLPEHLFKSALSSARNTKITFADEEPAPSHARVPPPQKRRRAKRSEKDVVLGSRTIRTLPRSSDAISPAAAKGLPPPRRVNKFLKHSLNVKGDAKQSQIKGWTRRAGKESLHVSATTG